MSQLINSINWGKLHHAYGVGGNIENVLDDIEEKIKKTEPDYIFKEECKTFSIEDARKLKSLQGEKTEEGKQRFFLVKFDFITVEAQNALLKILEEPSQNTYFFLFYQNIDELLPTLKSRIFILKAEAKFTGTEKLSPEKFLKLGIKDRLDLIKEITSKSLPDDEQFGRADALNFLGEMEKLLNKDKKNIENFDSIIKEIYAVKKFLSRNAPSIKMLMDHIAVILPVQ